MSAIIRRQIDPPEALALFIKGDHIITLRAFEMACESPATY